MKGLDRERDRKKQGERGRKKERVSGRERDQELERYILCERKRERESRLTMGRQAFEAAVSASPLIIRSPFMDYLGGGIIQPLIPARAELR